MHSYAVLKARFVSYCENTTTASGMDASTPILSSEKPALELTSHPILGHELQRQRETGTRSPGNKQKQNGEKQRKAR
jgi:hypothetical protein